MLQLSALVIAGVLFAVSRLTTPSAEQVHALALLESAQATGASNAFTDLWLLPWDIPERERDALVTQDIARLADYLAAQGALSDTEAPSFESLAEGRYPKVPDPAADDPALCDLRGDNCLEQVRRSPDAYARMLAGQQALLQRHRRLQDHDHYRSLFPPHLLTPLPPMQRMSLPLTAVALDFVQGRTEQALSSICANTATWRRLGSHSDSLVVGMVAVAIVQANARGFAQMLAELPVDHPLPDACDAAFVPLQAQALSLCPAMAGELAIFDAGLRDVVDNNALAQRFQPVAAVTSFLLYNHHRSLALLAGHYAWPCSEDGIQQLQVDAPMQPPTDDRPGSLACFSNIVGCILAGIAAPAYTPYQHRRQDNAAQLRAVATLLAVRDGCRERAVRDCLASLQVPNTARRQVVLSKDGRSLQIAMYSDRWGPLWSIPLPRELVMP